MIRVLTLLMWMGCCLMLTGCYERCESFNPAILDWMPFKSGDEFQIRDSLDIHTLTTTQSLVNHTIKTAKRTKCVCEDRYLLEFTTTWLSLDIFFHNSNQVENSDVVVNNELLLFAARQNNVAINGQVFADVIVYRNMSPSATTQFKEVIIAKSIGLVAIKGASMSWYRVDAESLEPDPSRIPFNNHSCV